MRLRLAWMPGHDGVASPECACLCVYAVALSESKARPKLTQMIGPAPAPTDTSMDKAARLVCGPETEQTPLSLLPGLVYYRVTSDSPRAASTTSGTPSPPQVCGIPGVGRTIRGCCWLSSQQRPSRLLAVASDQSNPPGANIDVFAVATPTVAFAHTSGVEASASLPRATVVGRFPVVATDPGFVVMLLVVILSPNNSPHTHFYILYATHHRIFLLVI